MRSTLPDVEAIKSRLVRAGYPPVRLRTETRQVTNEAQQARADLREHIIEDIWSLLATIESQRYLER